jgi:hypothetical protein
VPASDVLSIREAARFVREDQVLVLICRANLETPLDLRAPMDLEGLGCLLAQRDHLTGAGRLGILQHWLLAGNPDERPFHSQVAAVDVGPLEAERFAGPEARVNHENEKRFPSIASNRLAEPPRLVRSEEHPLYVRLPRKLHVTRDVVRELPSFTALLRHARIDPCTVPTVRGPSPDEANSLMKC